MYSRFIKIHRYWLILFVFLISLKADNTPQIFHQIPDKLYYDQFDWIKCVVDPGDYQLLNVSIFIKDAKENFFTEHKMKNIDGVYTFRVIPEMVQSDSLIYFFTAEFSDFSLLAFPEDEPKNHPITVPIIQEKRSAKVVGVNEVAKLFCDLGRNIENIKNVTIYTRYGQTGRFNPEPMIYNKERFHYTIRESTKKDEKLYYYISITFNDQTTLSYPSEDFDSHADYRILNGRRK